MNQLLEGDCSVLPDTLAENSVDSDPFEGFWRNFYGVVLCDPPWKFQTRSETRQVKSPGRHYQLMTLDDMKALPVWLLAAEDCALVMWAVQAMLPEAFDLMRAWKFQPKSVGAWAKQSKTGDKWAFGTGYIFRSAAEFFILGTRGKPKIMARDVRNLIVAPVREHSRKPDKMHANLERMFPDAPKLELFCRERRPGWECWGNDVDKFGRK